MRVALGLVLILVGCSAASSFAPAMRGVAPVTTRDRFLYVSDIYDAVVDIYTVPSLTFVRRLSKFLQPQGECTNAAGDVWIADTGYQQIVEYAPGKSKPMATLHDYLGVPAACAVNPVNGDLAVTEIAANSGLAHVLVYPNASGTPQAYTNAKTSAYYFAAYDGTGNLYVSGETSTKTYTLSRLGAHGHRLTSLHVAGATIRDAGAVVWNAGKLVLGDQACRGGNGSCLYLATVSGNIATVSSTLRLADSCDVVQVTVYGGDLYGGNDEQCGKGKSSVDRWSYGSGSREASVSGVREPVGVAVSGPPTERR